MRKKQTKGEARLCSPGHLCKDTEALGIFQVLERWIEGQKYSGQRK